MDSCGSIGGVNSHKGDTDDYKHEVTYNNTLHKVSSEMLLGLIYGLVNPHTLIVIIISSQRSEAHGLAIFKRVSTFLCSKDIYKRREEALQRIASMRGNVMGLYWIHRDWDPQGPVGTRANKMAGACSNLFDALRVFLLTKTTDRQEALRSVYQCTSSISLLNWELTAQPAEGSSDFGPRGQCPPTHASRANQYTRFIINDFERLRVIRDYRTPQGLRLFSTLMLHLMPIILGPTFAGYCSKSVDPDLGYGCASSYFTAVIYFMVTLTLFHVQQDLEDPYDDEGWDDINLNLTPELQRHMALKPDASMLKHPGIAIK
ncbi:hypothetical protein NFJ02_28g65280 [Pycnococcus provasolii]